MVSFSLRSLTETDINKIIAHVNS